MRLIPIKTDVLKPGQKVFDFFIKHASGKIKNNDLIALSSKLASNEQGGIIELAKIKPSKRAFLLARKYALPPAFCQIVINEADKILGGVKGALLTKKDGFVTASAGLDRSNAKKGFALLWPKDREKYLDKLKNALESHFKIKLGLIMVDSCCSPLRLGTRGLALAISGFVGIIDERKNKDIFGHKMTITRLSLADNLACAANLLMGETNQKTPFVILRGVKVKWSKKPCQILSRELKMNPRSCLFQDYSLK